MSSHAEAHANGSGNANPPPATSQLSPSLPAPTVFVTGHSPARPIAQSTVHSVRPVRWTHHDAARLAMSVAYTTTFPPDLNADADMAAHDARMAAPGGGTGLVVAGGTALRYVDIAPGYTCPAHRTQSLDYAVVLEGTMELLLDGGETTLLRRGDVAVQRATMHAWRNPSGTEFARMLFCLQDCRPLVIGGVRMGEDLGQGMEGVSPSGNDAKL